MMRLEGGQIEHFTEQLERDKERTDNFSHYKTLANDRLGYKVIHLLAILTHPCQTCAENTEAWHTRSGFCTHKKP